MFEDREPGKLCDPDEIGEIRAVQTPRGEELHWVLKKEG